MKMPGPSPEAIKVFEALMDGVAGVQIKKMFGCPCAFYQGKMFFGVYADSLFYRLLETDRQELVATKKAVFFEPQGRRMKEYICVLQPENSDVKFLQELITKSIDFIHSQTT